jgi:hypothetical protein
MTVWLLLVSRGMDRELFICVHYLNKRVPRNNFVPQFLPTYPVILSD